MTQIIRNLILAIIGLTVLVALLTAGLFIGLAALAAGLLLWGYVTLKARGILGDMKPRRQESLIIEAEYQVVEEKDAPREKEKEAETRY